MTLRSRLAWTYGIAFFIAAMLIAIVALIAVDRSLRSSLDARLTTAAVAATGLIDVHHGKLSFEADDQSNLISALPTDMQAAVISVDGRSFATSSPRVPADILSLRTWSDASGALYVVDRKDGKLRVAVSPVMRGGNVYGAVAVWEGADYIDEFDRNAIIAFALASLLIGGIVVVLSSALAHRALAPLERFTSLATEIEAHDLSRRIESRGNDELSRLASAFDRMLDRLEAAFARQRQFTADASHELRAPLAVMRAEADVALERERSVDQYRTALETIVQEVDRIDALVDGLLVVARADSSRLLIEPIDVSALVLDTVTRFEQAAASRRVAVEAEVASVITVEGDGRALERALASIVHNAIEFAAARVRLSVNARQSSAIVTVEDDGPGFSPEALTHATERFWRADPVRRRGGTGLGLSIADAIVRAHGGSLALRNGSTAGAVVEIRLPFIDPSFRHRTIGS